MSTTDSDLIARARSQDPQAFGELVHRYQDRLLRSINRMVGGKLEAEDIVQDTFYKAFLHLNRFRLECSFYTWLFGIARNSTISLQRKKRPAQMPRTRSTGACHEPCDTGISPEHHMLLAEQQHQVRVALERLPDILRTVLILRECEGFDYATIAHMLQIEIGTVRSRLHRARQALREQFDAG
jgi:RNA polymerase sigma-70 factor (ECF subfamily)